MDKSLFEKYINEMKEFKKRSTLPVLSEEAEISKSSVEDVVVKREVNPSEMDGLGELLINVTSVKGLYPIPDAVVTIFTGDAENKKVFAKGVTDISGKAGPFPLPAPSIVYSESPDSSLIPFSTYNLLTEADGFLDTIHLGVQIFDKITSIQSVNLLTSLCNEKQTTLIINEETEREVI